jgi:hypothetical protein
MHSETAFEQERMGRPILQGEDKSDEAVANRLSKPPKHAKPSPDFPGKHVQSYYIIYCLQDTVLGPWISKSSPSFASYLQTTADETVTLYLRLSMGARRGLNLV